VQCSQQNDSDVDLAVFRFTLGIPGLDDADIPLVVGVVGSVLLIVNHSLSVSPSDAQVRTETIGAVLAAACLAIPSLDKRLSESRKGVRADRQDVQGGTQVFGITEGLSDEHRQELAWATFALLRNTNACSVLVVKAGKIWCARGSVPTLAATGDPQEVLDGLSEAVKDASAACDELAAVQHPGAKPLYLADGRQLSGLSGSGWAFVPSGVKSVLVLPCTAAGAEGGMLILLGSEARAFSTRERAWAGAVANKLVGL